MRQYCVGEIDWHYEEFGKPEHTPLLLLHGFTGSSQAWSEIVNLFQPAYSIVAVDLPGHGRTPTPNEKLSLFQLADSLADFIHGLGIHQPSVVGYSMGGRIALHLALEHQHLLKSLILMGASPGIQESKERAKRQKLDRLLAESIRQKGLEWFVEFWEQQPIFKSQKSLTDKQRSCLRAQRFQNSPEGLAYALEQWSPGNQKDLLPGIHKLSIPVLLLAGERDRKYSDSNSVMEKQLSRNVTNIVVPEAGHAIHIEQPESVAKHINDFLSEFGK